MPEKGWDRDGEIVYSEDLITTDEIKSSCLEVVEQSDHCRP